MKPVNLIFLLNFYQPSGNMEHILEDIYQNSYKPFLKTLIAHPNIKATVHYTGSLLKWIEAKHPSSISRITTLIQNDQLEILSGTFYDAILPVIPDMDKHGQINLMNEYIKKLFNQNPTGMWLTEKIWEPHIASTITACGLQYTCIDDTQLLYAGVSEETLNGYYITEENGQLVKLLPMDSKLRLMLPIVPVKEIIAYIESKCLETSEQLLIFGDAGEKFGTWPQGTDVFSEGYLHEFFTAIEDSALIKSVKCSEYITNNEAIGKVYIPASSYCEMMEWALSPRMKTEYQNLCDELKTSQYSTYIKQIIPGSIWRNFFINYPESNNMHKKMLYVSEKVHKTDDATAMNLLWSGQSHLPYWHGIYGGIYLSHIRDDIYRKLIKAEYLVDYKAFKTKYWLVAEKYDFDKDGHREILVNSNLLNVYITSQKGGSIYEIDYKPTATNVINTISRKSEPYHKYNKSSDDEYLKTYKKQRYSTQTKDTATSYEEVKAALYYDNYRRILLVDHFVDKNITPQQFYKSTFIEYGDFVEARYESSILELTDKLVIKLYRRGVIHNTNIMLEKKIIVYRNKASIDFEYTVKNYDNKVISFTIAPELNFNLLSGYSKDRCYLINNEISNSCLLAVQDSLVNVSAMSLIDHWQGLRIDINFEKQINVLRCPIETVSKSHEGFEKIFQGSSILPMWDFSLNPEENCHFKFSCFISSASSFMY